MLTYADVWQVIREATADKQAEPTDRLSLRAHMPSVVDQESMGMGAAQHSWDSLSVTCKLFVSYSGMLFFFNPPPFFWKQKESIGLGAAQQSWASLSVACKLFVSDSY